MKKEIEQLKKQQKAKLEKIQQILNLDFSLEALMKARGNSNSNEMLKAREHREMVCFMFLKTSQIHNYIGCQG